MSWLALTATGSPSSAPIWTYEWAAIGTLVTAFITMCAFVGAVIQLGTTRKSTLETRAAEYLRRYDDPQLTSLWEKAHFVIGKSGSHEHDDSYARYAWWDGPSRSGTSLTWRLP
jgi:hypothetical protein